MMPISHMIVGAFFWRNKNWQKIFLGAFGGLLPDIIYVAVLTYTTVINIFNSAPNPLQALPTEVNEPGLWLHSIWLWGLLALTSYFWPKIWPLALGGWLHIIGDWLTHSPLNYAPFWPNPWRLPGGPFPTMVWPYKPTPWWYVEIGLIIALLIIAFINIRKKERK